MCRTDDGKLIEARQLVGAMRIGTPTSMKHLCLVR